MRAVEILEETVWSIWYDGEEDDIFSLLLNRWQDAEYIHSFFHTHRSYIDNFTFWQNCSFQQVMMSAYNEARNLESYFIQLYRNGEIGITPDLVDKFVLLDKKEGIDESMSRRKMYGKLRRTYPPSVLRLYALRLDSEKGEPPIFIITGGGIKLTERMNQMPELKIELDRMQQVKTWLESNGVFTKEHFYTFNNNYVQEH